jgi:S1-C subfamily serine protease
VDINNKIVAALDLKTKEGVLVTAIYRNGPADVAGLIAGDVIIAINGILATSMSSAIQEFANSRPGDILTIDILRDGKEQTVQAVLSAAPE